MVAIGDPHVVVVVVRLQVLEERQPNQPQYRAVRAREGVDRGHLARLAPLVDVAEGVGVLGGEVHLAQGALRHVQLVYLDEPDEETRERMICQVRVTLRFKEMDAEAR